MLIKIYLDDSFPIALPGGPQMAMWLVHETLPLNHPKQAEALLKAAKLPATKISELDLTKVWFTLPGQVYVDDANKTITELGIKAGTIVRMTTTPPRGPSQIISPRGSQASPGSPGSARGMSSMTHPADREEDDDGDMDGATRMHLKDAGNTSGSEDELYDARDDFGWFPFTQKTDDYGEAWVEFPNPDVEPREQDPLPNTHRLCHTCADSVVHTDSLRVDVTKHYKPMLMTTDAVEGKVEKVGGVRIPRWQNRWLSVNEKSLNWYESEPKIGSKDKLKGSRPMWDGNKLLLVDILENPDPNKYPKVKDKTSLHHFGVVFIGSSRDQIHMIFRVQTIKEKSNFVSFLQGIMKRAANHGASRDPVHWKRTANSFLLSLGDVGELSHENDEEEEALTEEIKLLEKELEDLRTEKPKLEAELEDTKSRVKLQLAETENLNNQLEGLRRKQREAEAKVRQAQEDYVRAEQEIAEEMKLKKMLELRAGKRKIEFEESLTTLHDDLEKLKAYQVQLFAQWRKSEENHTGHREESNDRHFSFSVDGSLMSLSQSMSLSRAESMEIQQYGSPLARRSGRGLNRQSVGRSGSLASLNDNSPPSPSARNPRGSQR